MKNDDEEVRLLHLHGQPSLDGTTAPPRTLFVGDDPDETVFEYLRRAQQQGREIQMWVRSTEILYRFAPVISQRFEHEQLGSTLDAPSPLRRGTLRFKD